MSVNKRPPRGGSAKDVKLKWEGLPFRGKVQNFKESDPEELQPQMGFEAHVEIFELNDDDQKASYQEVVQKLVADEAILSYEEKEYDETIKSWRILIVYSDVFYTPPEKQE